MSQEKYSILYWSGLPGRAEFIRLIFEDAGVKYGDEPHTYGNVDWEKFGVKQPIPFYAVPLLFYTNGNGNTIALSQTPNIASFLDSKLGFKKTEEEKHQANQYFLTMMDLMTEFHDLHHPVTNLKLYDDQKEVSLMKVPSWRDVRMPKFLQYFEESLVFNKKGNGKFFVGEDCSYVDLALFQIVKGLQFSFPAILKKYEEEKKFPHVFDLANRVEQRKNIQQFLLSSRRNKFEIDEEDGCSKKGIFRYYKEWQN
eukprot:TRINITY_DN15555_c0_g1_i1.p1 TRINITY_DN15555_c0_g1~~TRINITY_DN15555_c0_g1_i1.p1  ORF type:complete len:254 (+),score=74.51 TRINITY_DN15555_c0_g1_i1:1-762(+)